MTKSFEELESMTVPQLQSIATSLGADPKSNIKKAELVQLVYDLQQPEPPEETEDEEPAKEENKPIDTEKEIDDNLELIKNHFNGTDIEADGEDEEGRTIFVVKDELVDEELARGTYHELFDQVTAPGKAEEQKPTPDADGEVEGFEEVELTPDLEPVVTETPALQDDGAIEQIEKALNALKSLGLRYEINGSTIKLSTGSKNVTTTLNQPAHRVVRTAEQLVKYR